jgi:hypothetical protein
MLSRFQTKSFNNRWKIPSKKQVLEDLLILNREYDYIRVYDTSIHTLDIL